MTKNQDTKAENKEYEQKVPTGMTLSYDGNFLNIQAEKIRIDKSQKKQIRRCLPYQLWTKELIEKKEGVRLFKCVNNCLILKKYGVKCKKGIPDYCYEKEGILFFVECKTAAHGLHYNQIKWMQENNQFRTRVVYLEVLLKKIWPDGVEDVCLKSV